MRFTNNEAVELGNALLDAVELSKKCNDEVNITSTRSGNLLAIHGDKDCGTRYTVDRRARDFKRPFGAFFVSKSYLLPKIKNPQH